MSPHDADPSPAAGDDKGRDSDRIDLHELVRVSGIETQTVIEWVQLGLLETVDAAGEVTGDATGATTGDEVHFHIDTVVRIERITRLRHELEIEAHACGVVLDLLDRVHALETELARLRQV